MDIYGMTDNVVQYRGKSCNRYGGPTCLLHALPVISGWIMLLAFASMGIFYLCYVHPAPYITCLWLLSLCFEGWWAIFKYAFLYSQILKCNTSITVVLYIFKQKLV